MFKHQLQHLALPHLQQSLPVLTIDLPATESVTVMFLANTGARYESKAQEGIAHFFEHMVFKGTVNYPDAKTLARALDSVGADFNAFTGKEYTGYYVKAAANNFDLALDVLSDMLFAPKLLQEDIDREKGVIIEELNMYVDMPQHHVANVYEQLLYADRGLAHDIVGEKATVRAMTTADFQNFLNRFYGPENLLLVIAGGLQKVAPQKKVLLDKISLALQKLQQARGEGSKLPAPTMKRAGARQINENAFSQSRFKLIKRATEQAHFVLGWPSLDAHHPDRFILSVLSTIIGGNMSARLFAEVRERRGLCYYVRSDLEFYHDAGNFGASAGVDPGRIEEAIQATKAVFYDLINGQGEAGENGVINRQELLRAQNYLKGKTLLSLEDSGHVAEFYGFKQLLNDNILSPAEVIAKIEAVTLSDLKRVAKMIIRPDQLRLAIIGNFEDEAKLKKIALSWFYGRFFV